MSPVERPGGEASEPAEEPDLPWLCAMCGRELWIDGLPPARDGDAWICGECDTARNMDVMLDL